jgi:hypothetical protein
MVAAMPASGEASTSQLALSSSKEISPEDSRNRVFKLLIRRMNSCRAFSENLIFMLNRASSRLVPWLPEPPAELVADRSAEDRCMQVLVLKLLYLIFTTSGISEFFYTNDLCVLVDVFLRELVDLDESSESVSSRSFSMCHIG